MVHTHSRKYKIEIWNKFNVVLDKFQLNSIIIFFVLVKQADKLLELEIPGGRDIIEMRILNSKEKTLEGVLTYLTKGNYSPSNIMVIYEISLTELNR